MTLPFLVAMGLQAAPYPDQPRYTRRLDGPQRRLTPEEAAEENRRLYGSPSGPPDPSSRRTRGVPQDPISRRRRAESEEVRIPRRPLPKEGPER